jgi:gamma-glutamylcyclotransferase (GGCT)/AIG2-like uncharacterized protein YtfP
MHQRQPVGTGQAPLFSPHMNEAPTPLFAYGTLLFDEILQALTDRTFETLPAVLRGFTRHAIVRGETTEAYPAIRPDPAGNVAGRVLLNLDASSARLIDLFESDPPDYQVTPVRVESADGRMIAATTYIARPGLVSQLKGVWSRNEFKRRHLAHYVDSVIPELRQALER